MIRLKRILASMLLSLGFAAPALIPAVASAAGDDAGDNINNQLCAGANLDFTLNADDATCESDAGDDGAAGTLNNIITTIVNIISLIVGIVAVIMIIIGGLRYITSNGDSGNVTNAKNTILYAIVGLVIVALAQIIVRFVTGRLNQADTTP